MEYYNQIHKENLHRLQRAEKTMTDKVCHKTEEQGSFKGRVASYRYYMQAKQSLEKRFENKCLSELYESQISKEKNQPPNDYLIQMKSKGALTIPGQQAIRNKTLLAFCNDDFSVSTRKHIQYFEKPGQENQIWTKLYNKLIKMKNHIEALQAINTYAQQALKSVDADKIKQPLDQISNKQQFSIHQILAMLTQIANKDYTEAQKSMKSLNLGEQQLTIGGLIRESLTYSKIEQISQGSQFKLQQQEIKLLNRPQYDMIQKYQSAIESVIGFTQANSIIKQLAEKPQKYRDVCMKLPRQIEQGISILVQKIQSFRKINQHRQFFLQRFSPNKVLYTVQQSQMDPKIRQAYKTTLQKINSSTHAIPRTFEAYIQNQKIYIEQLLGSGLVDSECIRNYNPFQTGAEFISVSLNNLIEKMHSLKQLTIKLATFLDPQRQQQITKNEKELKDSKGEWTLTLLTKACHSVKRRMEDPHYQNRTLKNRIKHLQSDQSTQQQLKKAEQQNSLLQTSAEARQRQIISLSDKFREKSEELEQSNNEMYRIEQRIRQQNEEIEGLELKVRSLMKQANDKGMRNINKFFVGEIMDNLEEDKKWLIENIEDRLQKIMKRTRLLYKFDKISKVNFHKYIDNRPNLILILKTVSGKLLGAFSAGACVQEQCATDHGFLYSLTNRMIFGENKKNKSYKAIIYDRSYAIFGNSQLKVKAGDDKVFSYFAIVNNFFETKGHNVDALLGQGPKEREVKIDTYEFYQIEFCQ